MSSRTDVYTIGAATFFLVRPDMNQWAPEPEPGVEAIWQEYPYADSVRVRKTGRKPTIWTPEGGIKIMNLASKQIMQALYRSQAFAALVADFGTFQATITAFNVAAVGGPERSKPLFYQGSATFEWLDRS